MKVSLDWLRQYCPADLPRKSLLEKFSMIGLNVEDTVESGGDLIIELEVTSNRGDCLSHIGVSRELSAATGIPLQLPPLEYKADRQNAADVASVEVLDGELCPRYTARIIRDVTITESPDWLKKRIESIGLRPVNNVVDITNFVLMECGQPLHAFDLDKLKEKRIVVRRARKGEIIVAIDGTKCELNEEMLIIADAFRPVAIAGVMGGLDTEVSASTRNILLESADFDAVNVRRTARALGLESDSSLRFGRGVAWDGVDWASRRAAALMAEIAGGKILDGVIDVQMKEHVPAKVRMRFARIPVILGVDVPSDEAVGILESLGFEVVERANEWVEVTVPSHRSRDVSREIDLIEEVARHFGYDKLDIEKPIAVTVTQPRKRDTVEDIIKSALVTKGYCETLTIPFTGNSPIAAASMWDAAEPLTLRNPVNREQALMRRSMLPSLLSTAAYNENRGASDLRLFEISKIFLPSGGEELPEEKEVLALLAEQDFAELKGGVETILQRLRVEGARFEPAQHPGLDEGPTADIFCGERKLGVIGMISRDAVDFYDLRRKYCFAELDFLALVEAAFDRPQFSPLPRFPAVERDLAIIIDEDVKWRDVKEAVFAADAASLRSVEFIDLYRGRQLPAGKKSFAFRLVYRSDEETLTGDNVAAAQKKVLKHLEKKVGAKLRQ